MKIKLINFSGGKPVRKHYNDAGADVAVPNYTEFPPHSATKVPLGFGVEIPDGFMGCIFPRTSVANQGLTCELPPIDSGYRGEIHAIVTNHTTKTLSMEKGERVGQLVIVPVVLADFVEDLGEERGAGAFGSTGR